MSKKPWVLAAASVVLAGTAALVWAGSGESAAEKAAPEPAAVHAAFAAAPAHTSSTDEAATALEVVPTETVCMVNDRAFGRPQIPVEVEGRTYYGCCEGCKQRLAEDGAIRTAADPVTGEAVDKATAVIAARADGSVLYFASAETLERFRRTQSDR